MTKWHEVHDSRAERPEELDATSSTAVVYERRNIRQENREAQSGGEPTKEWVYDQREFTAEEYAAAAFIEQSPAMEKTAAKVDSAQGAASIAFVTMAEAGTIDNVTAAEHADLFTPWAYPVAYKVGQIRRYEADGKLYKCLQAHTSQADWNPPAAVSLWVAVSDPAEEWPEWSQPVGAHDAYEKGAKVSHSGKHWISDVDANVWEPGAYGWTEAAAGA